MIIKHRFSDAANAQELHYRNEVQSTEEAYSDLGVILERIRSGGYLEILPFLATHGIQPRGEGLEIGAGHCWLTAQISQLPGIERVHALDFSETLLMHRAPVIIRGLGGRSDRIQMHLGDFHDLLDFDTESLDFVVADAALHHTNYLERVLSEVHRVLKPGGLALAVDEPGVPRYLTPLTRSLGPEHFGAHERSLGVIENTYPEAVWARFFETAGFRVHFVPFFFRRGSRIANLVQRTPLVNLNGLIFWDKVIVAYKPA